jgi:flagellar protein FliS
MLLPATPPSSPLPAHRPPARALASARTKYRSDGANGMSGGRLLVALYQRLVGDLLGAETAIGANDVEGAHTQLVHAQDIVDTLDEALDHAAWDQAPRMAQIYAHVRAELVRANTTKDASVVADCRRIIEPLSLTWQQALDLTAAPAGESLAVGR